jgi:hypothetical protein
MSLVATGVVTATLSGETRHAFKKLPVTALIRNAHGVAEWKLFLNE